MANKWITIIFIIMFIAYMYQKQPIFKPAPIEDHERTEKILEKIGTLIDNVSEDMNRNKPIAAASNENKNYNSIDEGIKDLKDKAVDFTYNFIQSKIGQDILEKILYTPSSSESPESIPNLYHNNSMTDVITGEGDKKAECGDIVQVHYITKQVNGTEIENTYNLKKPISFQLGDRKAIRGIEYAVIGMKEGGIRRLIVPPKYAYKDVSFSNDSLAGNEYISIEVELLHLTSNDNTKNIRVYEKTKLPSHLTSVTLCSNPVYFSYNIADINGKVIYQSKSLSSFILGSKDIPQSLSKALTNIKSPAQYTVILPSSIIDKKTNFIPKNIKLPKNKAIMLDITTTS